MWKALNPSVVACLSCAMVGVLWGSKELSAAWFGSHGKLVVKAQDDAPPKVRLAQTGRFTCSRFEKKSWQLVATREALFQGSLWSVELSHPQRNIH